MSLLILLITLIFGYKTEYKCLPCGSECDKTSYDKPGSCPHCTMKLVDKKTIRFGSVKPTEICDYIKTHPDAVLLDVRTKEEFEGKADPNFGTLKKAININVEELENKLSSISALKKKEIIVFCSHSHRSPRAAYILNQHGFNKVKNMEGGMSVMHDNVCIK
jgi:rhodanese-related sulfurtransferase/DNA-directed RNA polymerase subunit RPC12/RpoP